MKIEKITDKYSFSQEGVTYTVDMGNVKRAEYKSVELLISELENSELLTVHPKCGCTTEEKKIIDKNTVSVKLVYNDCDTSFAKIVELKYNKVQIGIIKIKGKCQQ